MEAETLTIKFDGQSHQVDVQTFVYSVLHFTTVVKETNARSGGQPLTINIKAPQKGSLLVDLVTQAINNPTLIDKGDQLKVDLQITQVLDESIGIHVNQSFAVLKVYEHIKRAEPLELPFNKQIE